MSQKHKNVKNRQKSLEKQKAKRKQKNQAIAGRNNVSPIAGWQASLEAAKNWPVRECLLTETWREPSEIIQILVAREGPSGRIAVGAFLVDLGCLGVKNANAAIFRSWEVYEEEYRQAVLETQPLIETDLNTIAKIIDEATAYAKSLGFAAHRDFAEARAMLSGAEPNLADLTVPLGKNGKPFFVQGPHDNTDIIIQKLIKAVGVGNFEYTLADIEDDFDDDGDGFDDEEDDD